MTYTSRLPPTFIEKASCEPSGEKTGVTFSAAGAVTMTRASPPRRSTAQISPAYTKAIWLSLTVGIWYGERDCATPATPRARSRMRAKRDREAIFISYVDAVADRTERARSRLS